MFQFPRLANWLFNLLFRRVVQRREPDFIVGADNLAFASFSAGNPQRRYNRRRGCDRCESIPIDLALRRPGVADSHRAHSSSMGLARQGTATNLHHQTNCKTSLSMRVGAGEWALPEAMAA